MERFTATVRDLIVCPESGYMMNPTFEGNKIAFYSCGCERHLGKKFKVPDERIVDLIEIPDPPSQS